MITTVVNINHSEYDEYIGRGSLCGNPFTHLPLEETKAIVQVKTRKEAIDRYRTWFYKRMKNDVYFYVYILGLKGKRLGCHCKPKSCHGDIIVEFLEKGYQPSLI